MRAEWGRGNVGPGANRQTQLAEGHSLLDTETRHDDIAKRLGRWLALRDLDRQADKVDARAPTGSERRRATPVMELERSKQGEAFVLPGRAQHDLGGCVEIDAL